MLGVTKDGGSVELAMAGCNSVIGFTEIVRKNRAVFRAQVQIAGEAFRVGARVLQVTLKQESEIYIPLLDHTHTLSEQIAQAAVCNQFHTADQRLARWLLPRATGRAMEFSILLTRRWGRYWVFRAVASVWQPARCR